MSRLTRIPSFRLYAAAFLALFFGFTQSALAVTVCKDGTCDHTSIKQALLDPDHKGENVIVKPGVYSESGLTVGGTSQGGPRVLMSQSNDPEGTIIDATGSGSAVVSCLVASTIRAMTLRGGAGGVRLCFGGGSTLEKVIIENNTASGEGGGLQASYGPMTIIDTTFRNNKGSSGGAISMNASALLTIKNSTIEGNEATGSNGRAYGGGISVSSYVTMLIENTDITGNRATAPLSNTGGGIKAGSTTILNNVNLTNNVVEAATYSSNGGGIYKVKSTGSGPLLEINGGSISGNSADYGGGVWLGNTASMRLSGAAVSGNNARHGVAGSSGGGVFCGSPNNVSIAGNISGNSPDEVVGCGAPTPGTTRTHADNDNSGDSNDPVNTRTGEFYQQFDPDLNLGGPMPLYFSRFYASLQKQVGIAANMGSNWRHNFDWRVLFLGDSMHIVNHQGRTIQFDWSGVEWVLTGKTDVMYQLVADVSDYTLYDPRSHRSYTFDLAGQLTSVTDNRGNVHSLSYTSGLLTSVSDGLGRVLGISYDSTNRVSSVYDGLGRSAIFSYVNDDLSTVTDVNGNTTIYVYASGVTLTNQGLIWTITQPLGNRPFRHTYWYYNGLKAAGEIDSADNKTVFEYPSASSTRITDPLTNVRYHTHAGGGGLSNNEDEAGMSTVIGYDAAGRRDSMTDKSGNTVTNVYDADSGQLASIVMPGGQIDFDYTTRVVDGITYYDQSEISYPDGSKETFTYDAMGNMTTHTDQLLNTKTIAYTPNGQRSQLINRLGGTTAYSYNPDGTLATRTNNEGKITTYGYDGYGRLNLVNHPDGTSRSLSLDDKGRLLGETDELGSTFDFTYDINDNLDSVTDALDNVTEFAYDDNDRLISITYPLDNVSSRTYDELGRISVTTDGNDNYATLGYDTRGNVNSITDMAGNAWLTSHDADGFIESTTNPLGHTTSYTRDAQHRITRRTNPLGDFIGIAYDNMGRVSSTTDALGKTTAYTWDATGRAASVTLPDGAGTAYVRNAQGQITQLTDPNGKNWVSTYDQMGRKTSVADPLGNTVALTHDDDNRPSVVTFPDAMGDLAFTYDDAGNVTRLLYSDGVDLDYTYDANGRVTAADGITQGFDANGQLVESNGIVVGYDDGGRIITMELADGKVITYEYDSNSLLTGVSDWTVGSIIFNYDTAGRLTSMERPNGVDLGRAYDDNDRLTGITETGLADIQLSRNAAGQVTGSAGNVPDATTILPFVNGSRSVDAASQVAGYTYDALGRRTESGADRFDWDLASRLYEYMVDGVTTGNAYDALGRRTSRIRAAVTSTYVWNDALALPSVSIEKRGGANHRFYVHTPEGRLLYSIDATTGARLFYHFDEMGNTIFITDNNGSVVSSYVYSPYGQLLAYSGAQDDPFTWQGELGVMNEDNGLYYKRKRYYDAVAGRFMSRDPHSGATPMTVNPYQYAMGNPMLYVDPKGEKGESQNGEYTGSIADDVVNVSTKVASYVSAVGEKSQKMYANGLMKDAVLATRRDPASATQGKFVADTWRRVDKVNNMADNMKKLGNAANVLSAAGTGIKTVESLNRVHETGQRGRKTALERHYAQMDEIIALVKKGKISDAMAEKLIKDIAANTDDEIEGALWKEKIDTAIESLKSVKETLVGLAGPVGDAVNGALSVFGFGDPETD